MFYGIGKVSDYAQLFSLKVEANYRKKTGSKLRQDSGQIVMSSALNSSQLTNNKKTKKTRNGLMDSATVSAIKQKLRTGKRLSGAELKYLKENDPDLYSKAKKAEEYREELKQQLKRATTKSEARLALTQMQVKMLLEMTYGGSVNADPSANAGGDSGTASAAAGSDSVAVAADGGASAAASFDTSLSMSAGDVFPDAELNVNADSSAEAKANAALAAEAIQSSDFSGNAINSDIDADADDNAVTNEAEAREDVNKDGQLSKDELRQLATDAANAKLELDEQWLYVLRALLDEWQKYASTKTYREMSEDALDKLSADKDKNKSRPNADYDRNEKTAAGIPADNIADSYQKSAALAEEITIGYDAIG